MMIMVDCARGYTIDRVSISDWLSDIDIQEEMMINISENMETDFAFRLPENSFDILLDGQGASAENGSLSVPLNCTSCGIDIRYKLSGVVREEQKNVFSFSRTLNFPKTPIRLVYVMYLPPGMTVNLGTGHGSDEPDIVPSPNSVRTDGAAIILSWDERYPVLPKRYYIRYTEVAKPASNRPPYLFAVVAGLSILLAIGFGILYLRCVRKRPVISSRTSPIEIVKIPSALLSRNEIAVVDLLEKNRGEMHQRDIVSQLGWSKSQVSAVITNLLYKQVVEKQKIGRMYKVRLVQHLDRKE